VPLDRLVADKRASGTTVSVVIAALDEATTIGPIVTSVMGLVGTGAVDELVVVDGGSADGTAATAADAGARVVDQTAHDAPGGPGRGKGDAMWKGLAATTGDVVAFIDGDVTDWDTAFVTGPVGVLLGDGALQLVKAVYDRPLVSGGQRDARGGGRVTELVARPLIATFWPGLNDLAQPLSGEYAARRAALTAVPFPCGYGVELALLVDIAAAHGVDAIGQVDVGERVHANQSLDALGRMAAEVLHAAARRVGVDVERLGTTLRQPRRGADGRIIWSDATLNVAERPSYAAWAAAQG